jgi:hypothetical protein
MTLNDFWPPVDEDHTTMCLPTEAETASDQVFLAVHQPMRLTRELFNVQNAKQETQTEQQVLDALLVEEPPSGTLVLPIIGDSGVGKSHMIRWLDAHLRLRSDAQKRHIVRIPKSSSLRGVLELILDDDTKLTGKNYDAIRAKLNSASMPPSRAEAMYLLQGKLLFALEQAGKQAQLRLLEQKSRPDDRPRAAHCSPQCLMALLQDTTIQSHFKAHEGESETWGVLTRIADRCLHGSRRHDAGPLNQFLPSDFTFLSNVQVAALADDMRKYLPILNTPTGLQQAIGFLNEIVDQALAGLVDLGGFSLTDIFIDIRKALLADKLELVLLVEDFAVLAGIQGPLLDAMIREAIRDGKRELCTMRTALAVTEGKLPETVKTRAQAMWKIDSQPFTSEEEAMDTFENFVGGYLNAARWGAAKLRQIFDQRSVDQSSLSDWVPNYYETYRQELSEQDNEKLRAFDFSPREGHPLFPLNHGSVRQLARKYLRVDESYKFDPRVLINRLVRDTVINHRALWENGMFPPGDFNGFTMNALDVEVSSCLRTRVTPHEHNRVAALVHYWGDDPRSLGFAARLDRRIYDAFGLKPVDWQVAHEPKVKAIPHGGELPPPPPPPPPPSDPLGPWREILDAWRQTQRLRQNNANALRGYLADALNSWLDADSLLLKKISIGNESIYIPNTDQGLQVAEKAIAIAATDEDLKDDSKSDQFFAAMRSIVRYHTTRSWDYEGGERDAARYAALIGRMAKQAELYFATRGSGLPAEAVKPLAQALMIGARLLNLEGASINENTDNLVAMLEPGPANNNDAMALDDKWSSARCKAIRARGELRTALLEQVAARQGGGGEQAVDAARLLEAISELHKNSWQLPKDLDLDLFKSLPQASKEHLRELRDRLPSLVASRQSEVKAWRTKVVDALGEDVDLVTIVKTIRDTIKGAQDAGVFRWRDGSADTLRSRFDNLDPVKGMVDLTTNAVMDGAEFGASLSALAQLDDKRMNRVSQAISDYERFLNETASIVNEKGKDTSVNLDEITKTLDSEFESLAEHWSQITAI